MRPRSRVRLKHLERQAEGYLELGMPQHALDVLGKLGDSVEFGPRALYLMGEALRAQSRYVEALEPLSRAAQSLPGDVPLCLALGWCHKRTGRLDLAIAAMEQGLEVGPEEAILHYNLACYLSLAHQKEQALVHLSKALAIDPHYRNLIEAESDFDPIRSDPEFLALTSINVG